MNELNLYLADEAATEALGTALAQSLPEQLLVFLHGDLGAGKTTLVRGLVRALGHAGPVKSPTYTLIEPYELAHGRLYHLDLYRLGDPEELEYLGLRDMLEGRFVCLVEWPQRGQGWLPAPDLEIELVYCDSGRTAQLRAGSAAGGSLLERLRAVAPARG